jgi:hypothetical protein
LELVREYDKGSQYWDRYLFALLKLYCVPGAAVRSNCLENLILILSKELSYKLKIPLFEEPLLLLLEDGNIVEDLLDIPFTATRMYLAKTEKPEKAYL